MAVDESFLTYCIDQLDSVQDVHYRKMFGGAGIYAGEVFFALVSGEQLYFKTSPENEKRYTDAGMGPFIPFEDKPNYKMSYHEVPLAVLEQPQELYEWASEAIAVAFKSKKSSKKKKAPKN